jgi:hypothetical protein
MFKVISSEFNGIRKTVEMYDITKKQQPKLDLKIPVKFAKIMNFQGLI